MTTEPTQRTEADALNELRVKAVRELDAATLRIAELEAQLRTQATEHSLANRWLEDEIGRLQKRNAETEKQFRILCDDWASDHTHLEMLCREAGCKERAAEGDFYGVPGIKDLANILVATLSPSPPAVDTASKCPECGTNHGCLCDDALPVVQTEEKSATVPWWVKHPWSPETTDAHDCVRCGVSMSLSADSEWDERPEYNFCHNCAHELVDECMDKLAITVPQSFNEWFNTKVPQEMRDAYLRPRMQMAWDAARAGTVPLAVAEKLAEALELAHPARVWDLARQFYTSKLSPETTEGVKAVHDERCKAVDESLATFQASTK